MREQAWFFSIVVEFLCFEPLTKSKQFCSFVCLGCCGDFFFWEGEGGVGVFLLFGGGVGYRMPLCIPRGFFCFLFLGLRLVGGC